MHDVMRYVGAANAAAGTWGPIGTLRLVSLETGARSPVRSHLAITPPVWSGQRDVTISWWAEDDEAHAARAVQIAHNPQRLTPPLSADTTSGASIVVHLVHDSRTALVAHAHGLGPWAQALLEPGHLGARDGKTDVTVLARRVFPGRLGGLDGLELTPWVWQLVWDDGWHTRLYVLAHGVSAVDDEALVWRDGAAQGLDGVVPGLLVPVRVAPISAV